MASDDSSSPAAFHGCAEDQNVASSLLRPASNFYVPEQWPWLRSAVLATPLVPTALQGQLPYVPPKDFFAGLAESCLFKGVTSLVVGGGLGLLAGVVIGGWQSATPPMALPGNPEVPRTTAFRALRETGTLMSTKSISWGKNFAVVGGMFSLVECAIEKTRGQHDLTNSVAGGCVTGAALARNQGPAAMVMGCGGFALFSAAIGMCREQVRGIVWRNLAWQTLTHVHGPHPLACLHSTDTFMPH